METLSVLTMQKSAQKRTSALYLSQINSFQCLKTEILTRQTRRRTFRFLLRRVRSFERSFPIVVKTVHAEANSPNGTPANSDLSNDLLLPASRQACTALTSFATRPLCT